MKQRVTEVFEAANEVMNQQEKGLKIQGDTKNVVIFSVKSEAVFKRRRLQTKESSFLRCNRYIEDKNLASPKYITDEGINKHLTNDDEQTGLWGASDSEVAFSSLQGFDDKNKPLQIQDMKIS